MRVRLILVAIPKETLNKLLIALRGLYVDARGKETWSEWRHVPGRPNRGEARVLHESLSFRLAPRPLLHKAGENRRHQACMFKLDRRRYRVGEPEPA